LIAIATSGSTDAAAVADADADTADALPDANGAYAMCWCHHDVRAVVDFATDASAADDGARLRARTVSPVHWCRVQPIPTPVPPTPFPTPAPTVSARGWRPRCLTCALCLVADAVAAARATADARADAAAWCVHLSC
jgi:hypothetical protein